MKKIIVGFDGTAQARDALDLGAELAEALDARLIVASAFEAVPLEIAVAAYAAASDNHFKAVFAKAADQLGSREFERRELTQTPARGVSVLAEDEQADLIIVGSTHHGAFGRALAGAVGTALFQGAPCGVMIAPRGWAEREHVGLGVIGVAYDGSEESKLALDAATRLAKAFDATLRVIAIAPYVDPHLSAVVAIPEPWVETLKEGVELVPGELETERVLRQGRPATELALQGVELDLLVVGSRGYGPMRRTLLGSVSGELVRTAPCPVLVMPRGAEAPRPAEAPATAATA